MTGSVEMSLSISLIEVPSSMRKGTDRRLPRGSKFKNLTGQKFERCRVIGFAGFKWNAAAWLCRCECGEQFVIVGAELVYHRNIACGCGRGELSREAKQLMPALNTIKQRCHNPKNRSYHKYGGCGIKVCKRWRESTEAFAADVGPRPSAKHYLVRHNKRGHYTLKNCYWGTTEDLPRGRPRELTHNGKTLNLARWAKELGISREAMRTRVDRCLASGLDPVLAITGPIRRWGPGRPAK